MKKKLPFLLAFVFFAAVAVLAGYKIYTILSEYHAEEQTSQQLQQYITLEVAQPPETTPASRPTEPGLPPIPEQPTEPEADPVIYPEVDFTALQAINPDVVAWIYIEDTNINYPVVQGADNSRYLSVMADGRSNAAGSIFMDYRSEPDFSDRHTVIYGHNMRNGSMFHNIRNYTDPEFYAAHPTGMMMTPEGNFQFEVIAGYVASVDDPAWDIRFGSDEEFDSWLTDTMARSLLGGTIVPDTGDRIITLSTCTYEFNNARFVLICRIMQ